MWHAPLRHETFPPQTQSREALINQIWRVDTKKSPNQT